MKRLSFLLGVVILSVATTFANINYHLDDGKIDDLFNQSMEVSIMDIAFADPAAPVHFANLTELNSSNEAVVAWLLCWVVGGFGVHRHYLGTKDNMWAIYTFTVCGIFGIVPFVDWWVLLIDGVINENVAKYQNNEKFFMW